MGAKIRYLSTGETVFKGRTYPPIGSISDKNFDKERWFNHWEKIADEIKSLKLDYWQISDIHKDFLYDIISYSSIKELLHEHYRVNQIGTNLKLAFHKAYSNYRDSRIGFAKIFVAIFTKKLIERLDFPKIPFPK